MNPEGAPLAHDAIQKERSRLRNFVILNEELLELIDEQQGARHRLAPPGALVARNVLHAELAE